MELGKPVQDVVASLDEAIDLYETVSDSTLSGRDSEEARYYADAAERAREAKETVRRISAAASGARGALEEAANLAAESEGSARAFEGFFERGGEGYEAERRVAVEVYGEREE